MLFWRVFLEKNHDKNKAFKITVTKKQFTCYKIKTMKKLVVAVFTMLSTSFFAQEVSVTDSTQIEQNFEKIKVIPNPTSEILFIRHGEDVSSYQLFNMQGAKVQEGKNNAQIISLIDEESGAYFLILEVKGTFKTFRVQKY